MWIHSGRISERCWKKTNSISLYTLLFLWHFFIHSSTSKRVVILSFNSSDLQTVYFLPHPVTTWVFKSNSKHSDTVLTETAEITVTILYTRSKTLTLLHSRKRCCYKWYGVENYGCPLIKVLLILTQQTLSSCKKLISHTSKCYWIKTPSSLESLC